MKVGITASRGCVSSLTGFPDATAKALSDILRTVILGTGQFHYVAAACGVGQIPGGDPADIGGRDHGDLSFWCQKIMEHTLLSDSLHTAYPVL